MNWKSDAKNSKLTRGYVFMLAGASISWKSSKKTVIAQSTMGFKFIALDKSGEKAEWLHHFMEDTPRWPKSVPLICIHYDSQSAIGRAHSSMYNVSLDIFVVDTIPLDNYSQLGLSL